MDMESVRARRRRPLESYNMFTPSPAPAPTRRTNHEEGKKVQEDAMRVRGE